MQKVLRRTALAKRQLKRRSAKEAAQEALSKRLTTRDGKKQLSQLIGQSFRAERAARREDWTLGPLAPRRDVGEAARSYGTVQPERIRGIEKLKWKDFGIAVGDRVVVAIKGHHDEGKIGKVEELSEEREECTVEGMNKADILLPKHMLVNESDKTPYRPFPLPLPLSGVRLVAKLPNPDTGTERDVVIKELTIEKTRGRDRDTTPTKRRIAGVVPKTYIPWPPKGDPEHDDYESDTLRLDVEETTWTPTLREPPMPQSIIDELRNKYGKFRTRHDDWYIAKKEAEARKAKQAKELLKLKMITPIQELKMKQKAEKEARGDAVLDDEVLAGIGEIMARNGRVPPKPEQLDSSANL